MSGNANNRLGSQSSSDRGPRGRGRGRGKGRGGGGRGFGPNPQNPSPPISARDRENAPLTRTMPSNSASQAQPTYMASTDPVLARRRMDLMASVSRSSGLEKDGDDLKNYKTQEEYRNFIQEKINVILEDNRRTTPESENDAKKRRDAQENILILFRKLREGVSSSSRSDIFALETYETSLFLAVLFDSPKQTIAIIPHLLPVRFEEPSKFKSPTPSLSTVMISLLHHLVAQYPSQSTFHQQLDSTPKELLPPDSQASTWLRTLTKSLRTRNYTTFSTLSQKSSILSVLAPSLDQMNSPDKPVPSRAKDDFGRAAVLQLLQALRRKAADTAWSVLRSAYRELTVDQTTDTKTWLSRSLSFQSLLDQHPDTDTEHWLVEKITLGHVRRKEGAEGRWIICKIR